MTTTKSSILKNKGSGGSSQEALAAAAYHCYLGEEECVDFSSTVSRQLYPKQQQQPVSAIDALLDSYNVLTFGDTQTVVYYCVLDAPIAIQTAVREISPTKSEMGPLEVAALNLIGSCKDGKAPAVVVLSDEPKAGSLKAELTTKLLGLIERAEAHIVTMELVKQEMERPECFTETGKRRREYDAEDLYSRSSHSKPRTVGRWTEEDEANLVELLTISKAPTRLTRVCMPVNKRSVEALRFILGSLA